jgi:pimeloyl-ACP methyl ester carboxylesterase
MNPAPLAVRTYGTTGPDVFVLHGGPAAAGNAAPIARELGASFCAIEPFQRGSGDTPLTVERHIADLHDLIARRCAQSPPALVGESWGAMLALCYAAAHPEFRGPLALIGCGTFDHNTRSVFERTLRERMSPSTQARIDALHRHSDSPDSIKEMIELTLPHYAFSALPHDEHTAETSPPFDMRAHRETWNDMLRLQRAGRYPAAFSAIRSPVLMMHGDYDPHPGPLIRDSLRPFIPHLEYYRMTRCGHEPWRERYARDFFFATLAEWLAVHTARRA